jgi:hypothetical protein
MPTATAAGLSATHELFVLEEIEVERPQRGEVLVPHGGDRALPCGPQRSQRASSPSRCPAYSGMRAQASSRRSATA